MLLVLIGIIKYFMVGPQWTVRWNLVNQDGSKTRYKIFLEPGNKTTNWLQNFLGPRRGLSRTDSKDREVWWHPEELGLFIQCPLSGNTINEIQMSFILKILFLCHFIKLVLTFRQGSCYNKVRSWTDINF